MSRASALVGSHQIAITPARPLNCQPVRQGSGHNTDARLLDQAEGRSCDDETPPAADECFAHSFARAEGRPEVKPDVAGQSNRELFASGLKHER